MSETLTERVALLRRASTAIRTDWDERAGVFSELRGYHLAMADWLDGEALTLGGMEPWVELFNAVYENKTGVVGYLSFKRDDKGEIQMVTDTSPSALRLARAYLGESEPTADTTEAGR